MPTATIFSDPSFLTLHLIESLLAKQCQVVVVSTQSREWAKALKHLQENPKLKLFKPQHFSEKTDYVFLLAGFEQPLDLKGIRQNLSFGLDFIQERGVKSLLVLPLVLGNKQTESLNQVLDQELQTRNLVNFKIIYLGQLYGPRMPLNKRDQLVRMIRSTAFNQPVVVPEKEFELFPLFVGDAVESLIWAMFSYGPREKRVALAERVKTSGFLKQLQKIREQATIVDSRLQPPKRVDLESFIQPKTKKEDSLAQTLDWLSQYNLSPTEEPELEEEFLTEDFDQEPGPEVKKEIRLLRPRPRRFKKRPRLFEKIRLKGLILAFLILLLWLGSLPFVSLFISAASLNFAYQSFSQGNWARAEQWLGGSQFFGRAGKQGFGLFSKTPIIGPRFALASEASLILERASQAGKRGLVLCQTFQELVSGVLGDQDYDLFGLSEQLFLDLGFLYQEASFLETEIKTNSLLSSRFSQQLKTLTKVRGYLKAGQTISQQLPLLLGTDQPQVYLVLFQNNMELRPTGGFIGSFSLATFDQGRLIDLKVNDVYSADGQLKGHVEPPEPVKDYLGEANWFLRDSNWDPDFPTAAERARWFLDKEIDRQVNGVVGIDLGVAQTILEQTGPIVLEDFDQEINQKNLYDRVQYEVENDFFPGSQKKANFLTALARSLLTRVTELEEKDYFGLGQGLVNNLESKSIQIFLDNSPANQALVDLGWSGLAKPQPCSNNCLNLWFGIVEANLGVNKVNYFIKRSAYLFSEVSQQGVKNRLVIDYSNQAPGALGLSGQYKNYCRLLLPSKAIFRRAEIVDSRGTKAKQVNLEQVADRLETGLLIEIGPGENKKLVLTWEQRANLDFNQPGKLNLFWRKQAGTNADPVTIELALPQGGEYAFDQPFSLTENQTFGYNTNLLTDFQTVVSW